MKKYEKLEIQIEELQKEVQRLKREERLNKLPDDFIIGSAKKVTEGSTKSLMYAFKWSSTPQGNDYWRSIMVGTQKLSRTDIIQIQRWIITAQENLLNEKTK